MDDIFEQLRAHAAQARRMLADIERAAVTTCETGLHDDLKAMDAARSRLESAIGAMRVIAITVLAKATEGDTPTDAELRAPEDR